MRRALQWMGFAGIPAHHAVSIEVQADLRVECRGQTFVQPRVTVCCTTNRNHDSEAAATLAALSLARPRPITE